ncbi:aminodeoxychorismate synthase, component I [Terriglobus roseus DSM 18391]|uniref:Aminodeoxychorismate synthase, component I n=2 Tax=Terriglobus roseus TaxID=392734 RepID=I3ZHH1_TERRK|nr:aminodeoxychorismate synthase, component I [Terriglobus roseus DSM 18391]
MGFFVSHTPTHGTRDTIAMPSVPADQPRKWTPLPASWRRAALDQTGTVLLESSLPSETQHHSYLFLAADRVLTAHSPQELPSLFEAIEQALAEGHWVAGSLDYEAGSHFLDLPTRVTRTPLATFGIYTAPRIFDHTSDSTDEPEPPRPGPLPIAPMLRIRREDYTAAIARIQRWIAAGDTYQLNFTTHALSPYADDAATLYAALQTQQPCSYGAILNLLPQQTVLSLSPELFFRATPDGTLTTKPMKGTALRGTTAAEDDARAESLRNDEKNRAEHVMIVDLLRNDLGRICEAGTVRVDRLFEVERYPTLLQMTSTITGRTPHRLAWYQVFRALFPSGSITGAPKRHTMALIAQIEDHPRGIYTGAIGYFAPDGNACFNVAIRTVVLDGKTMVLGVGGGIVADSTSTGEYDECLLKTAFLQRAAQPIQLIETMRWMGTTPAAPDIGTLAHERELAERIPLLPFHLQRLESSAASLGFRFDAEAILATIAEASTQWDGQPRRLRLLLHRNGAVELQHADAPNWQPHLKVSFARQITSREAPYLRHKSTFRPEYDPALREAHAAGHDEALFRNEIGEITEGCISSLLACLQGQWLTPPLASGCLPGTYRAALLEAGLIRERSITMSDLRTADHLCLCNAIRGTGCIASLQLPDGERIHYKIAAHPPQLVGR